VVLCGVVSKWEWLLGESAVNGLVRSDFWGSAFETDGGQDGEVFHHMLGDEGMGGGGAMTGRESDGLGGGVCDEGVGGSRLGGAGCW
jgi:hypothetical protein